MEEKVELEYRYIAIKIAFKSRSRLNTGCSLVIRTCSIAISVYAISGA